MAVIGSARPIQTEASTDDQRFVKYQSRYEVLSDNVMDDPFTIASAPGLPTYNSSYAWGSFVDPWALANSITCTIRSVDETRRLWTVTVVHQTVGATEQSQDQSEKRGDPIDWKWEISGDFAQFMRAADKDRDGVAILNAAKEPFIPPPERDDSRGVLVLKKNTPNIDLGTWSEFRDSVNSNAMWGLKKRQIKLNQWRWQVKFWGNANAYIANEWHFHISNYKDENGNVIGWTGYYLNHGRRYVANLGEADPKKRYALVADLKGDPLPNPGLLAANGTLLPDGAAPTYIKAEIEQEKDFRDIGIPDPLPGPFV